MKFTKNPIALIILAASLTACSGGSNKSTPAAESPKVNVAPIQKNNANTQSENVNSQTGNGSKQSENASSQTHNGSKQSEHASSQTQNGSKQSENTGSQTGNSSTQNSNSQSTNNPTDSKDITNSNDRDNIEYLLDPTKKVKWRQLTAFLDSSETDSANPLKNNGKMAPLGAAAHVNGDLRYSGGDLRKNLDKLDYDPSFLTNAEINPDKLQHSVITDKTGKTVVNTHFVNQTYSSYLSFKAEVPLTSLDDEGKTVKALDAPSAYIAVPTKADKAILDRKVKATYKGHTIGNQNRDNNQFTLGDIQIDADFEKMQISGEITKRNDELLRVRAKFKGAGYKGYTTDPEAAEPGTTDLINPEKMEELYAKHRSLQVKLLPADIKIANGVVSFENNDGALEFEAFNKDKVKTGSYAGIFAGPNAEEIVGEIKAGQNFISFGATEVQK
ncbi:hypothetical protein HT665_00910 [Ursidibacter maritimus]|uniref:Transferrin-binding protein B C-lobe/N-lobe beta barrel domain-containing protein n=1 Tax=Ursidibacter maritimus TaxID=1331689 RepID=A0A949T2X3_9PAST|nr:transferrin-binding protein-like solute binding protein [Ursidibacter maritimus]KAE9540386.1 hypothetical protein A1D26_01495 [Ursidibacter maritimus]MBV6523490.1 hypothetical protein [Ursidibacter maritimus]MBV6526729.1 hypothetical protein [Ursidibacter maritimus]MBV6528086.1 hypothetical protein [Ursidibacter maritimus]MBV6530426.1 hypothetical protein [Ursidibacter maritimus]